MKTYDDTAAGNILGRLLVYHYLVNEEMEGLEIEIDAVTDRDCQPVDLCDIDQKDARNFLRCYEDDLHTQRETGFVAPGSILKLRRGP